MFGSTVDLFRTLSSGQSADLARLIGNKGFSDRTLSLINSPGFHQAINECFPNDKGKQERFVNRLHLDDVLGECLGVAGIFRGGVFMMGRFRAIADSMNLSRTARRIIMWSSAAAAVAVDQVADHFKTKAAIAEQARLKGLSDSMAALLDRDIVAIDNDIAADQAKINDPGTSVEEKNYSQKDILHLRAIRADMLATR